MWLTKNHVNQLQKKILLDFNLQNIQTSQKDAHPSGGFGCVLLRKRWLRWCWHAPWKRCLEHHTVQNTGTCFLFNKNDDFKNNQNHPKKVVLFQHLDPKKSKLGKESNLMGSPLPTCLFTWHDCWPLQPFFQGIYRENSQDEVVKHPPC